MCCAHPAPLQALPGTTALVLTRAPKHPPAPRTHSTVHFFASSEKAKRELGWRPKHDFMSDVPELVKAYEASGRTSKDIDFSVDDKILAAMKVAA